MYIYIYYIYIYYVYIYMNFGEKYILNRMHFVLSLSRLFQLYIVQFFKQSKKISANSDGIK